MDLENMLKSLNMTDGEVLTLEKAKDRMEFAALPIMEGLEFTDGSMCRLYEDWECPELEAR